MFGEVGHEKIFHDGVTRVPCRAGDRVDHIGDLLVGGNYDLLRPSALGIETGHVMPLGHDHPLGICRRGLGTGRGRDVLGLLGTLTGDDSRQTACRRIAEKSHDDDHGPELQAQRHEVIE